MTPEISIVVPVRYAAETVEPTLRALLAQCAGLSAEIIAVVAAADPTRETLRALEREPLLRVIEMPGRRSVPQLRAEGMRAARGRLVAITEDHCLFSPGWVAGCLEALRGHPEAVAVGGPVENGRTGSSVDWAIFFSRYLVWMAPLRRGAVTQLPGNNACYRREVLEAHAALFAHGFWEHHFHNEVVARGHKLWLEPELVVTHNKPYRFGPYLGLRYRHARCFGGMEGAGRLRRLVLWPLLPLLMFLRAQRTILQKKRHAREFWQGFPVLLLCYGVWCWGDLVGLLFGPGDTCSETD